MHERERERERERENDVTDTQICTEWEERVR